jgi:hypothetical protein
MTYRQTCYDVQVSHELIVGDGFWEGGLGHELERLVVEVVVDVVSQEEVEEGGLPYLVMAEASGTVC